MRVRQRMQCGIPCSGFMPVQHPIQHYACQGRWNVCLEVMARMRASNAMPAPTVGWAPAQPTCRLEEGGWLCAPDHIQHSLVISAAQCLTLCITGGSSLSHSPVGLASARRRPGPAASCAGCKRRRAVHIDAHASPASLHTNSSLGMCMHPCRYGLLRGGHHARTGGRHRHASGRDLARCRRKP